MTEKPSLPRSITEYLHGYCHIFAVAAAIAHNCPVTLIWDDEAMDDDCNTLPFPCLVHAFIQLPSDKILDASGVRTETDPVAFFSNLYPVNEPRLAHYSVEDALLLFHKQGWTLPMENEIRFITSFITSSNFS